MRRFNASHCAIVAVALVATALTGSPAAVAAVRPPSEDVITNRPPPPVQGPPGPKQGLPCGIDGPALDLGDGSRYPSGLRPLQAAMIFVDFSDAPAAAGSMPHEAFNRLVPPARRTLRALSQRKLKLVVTPHRKWVRMPKPMQSYGFGDEKTKYNRYQDYITDALRAAAPRFDLSKFKTVYVVAGPNARAPQATTNEPSGGGIRAGGALVEHVVTLDGYGEESASSVVVHETGHVLGLPDLYEVGATTAWFRFVGPWDFMSDHWQAAVMLSWTRRMVGWLGDNSFRCVGRGKKTVRLSPVAGGDGIKGAVVRTGHRRAYIVEARTDAVGKNCPNQGVLVYRWDGNRSSGTGPIRVIDAQPGDGPCGPHTTALFKPGQDGQSRYEDRRVAVSVLGGGEKGFRVQILNRLR